jgi:uncharacterized repeat protein (TIGR01451 family)
LFLYPFSKLRLKKPWYDIFPSFAFRYHSFPSSRIWNAKWVRDRAVYRRTLCPAPQNAPQFGKKYRRSVLIFVVVLVFFGLTAVPQANLAITKSDSTDPVVPGSNFSYTLTVTNNVPSSAQTVSVSDTLPAGVTYVSDDCGLTGTPGPTVSWAIGSLANSASTTCNITVTAAGTDDDGYPVGDSAEASVQVGSPPAYIIFLAVARK